MLLVLPFASSYSFTHSDGLTFESSGDGIVKISDFYKTLAYQGFAIQGDILFHSYTYTSENFNWTWTHEYELIYDEYLNESYTLDTFTAYNNKARFNWTQVWSFDNRTNAKVKHIITNNLGFSITNTKLWYIHTLPRVAEITYNNTRYFSNIDNHLTGYFNNVIGKVNIGELNFIYDDILNSSYDITDIYFGNASMSGYPNRRIFAIGLTRGLGIFQNGTTIILDPFETSYYSPSTTGEPMNNWTDGSYVVSSNNQRAYVETLYYLLDTSDYSVSLPIGAIIEGIEVKIEGFSSLYGGRPAVYYCPE